MISRDPERILCSAIHFDNGKEYHHQPKNIKTGLVVCGYRHPNCIALLAQQFGLKAARLKLGKETQGFLTNKNRFVDRFEGMGVALLAHQIKNATRIKRNQLYSEHLY